VVNEGVYEDLDEVKSHERKKMNKKTRAEILQIANAAKEKILLSPSKRRLQKLQLALRWVHSWGCTTSALFCQAVGSQHPGFITHLVKDGLLRHEKIFNANFLLATNKGVNFLKNFIPEDDLIFNLPLQRKAISWGVEHNLVCQKILASELAKSDDVISWNSDRELRSLLTDGGKVPDASITTDLFVTYFEIELTKKHQRELEEMLVSLAKLLAKQKITYKQGWIFTKKIWVEHYERALDKLEIDGKYHEWELNKNTNRYICTEVADFTNQEIAALESIQVRSLPDQ